jgi:hypothetical protein
MALNEARIIEARAAVARFHQRFPDWENLTAAHQETLARRAHLAVERLITRTLTARLKPIRATVRAMKRSFPTRARRRDYLFERLGLYEDEILNTSAIPPADLHELPYLTADSEARFEQYPDPVSPEHASESCVKRAIRLGVPFREILDATDTAQHTTRGTKRYQAARRHWDAIQDALAEVAEADCPAPAPIVFQGLLRRRSLPSGNHNIIF